MWFRSNPRNGIQQTKHSENAAVSMNNINNKKNTHYLVTTEGIASASHGAQGALALHHVHQNLFKKKKKIYVYGCS